MSDKIKIVAEPQMDPAVCKFMINKPIYPDGSASCKNPDMAKGSPLLETLMAIDGVREVHVYNSTITVAKNGDVEWADLAKTVGTTIREQIQSDKELISAEFKNKKTDEQKIRHQVQELFDAQINPGIGAHGGSVQLVDIKGGQVFVELQGGCQGCASAKMTLKHGIEYMLKENIPEIVEVIDVTDHSAGEDPFF